MYDRCDIDYPGGELFYHLRRIKKMSEAEARFYFTEILLAFEYLHEHKVLYRDIKPENIMMDADGHLVLADFGLAKLGLGRSHKTYSFCGSH
jgi:serine/threonine protein kinase